MSESGKEPGALADGKKEMLQAGNEKGARVRCP